MPVFTLVLAKNWQKRPRFGPNRRTSGTLRSAQSRFPALVAFAPTWARRRISFCAQSSLESLRIRARGRSAGRRADQWWRSVENGAGYCAVLSLRHPVLPSEVGRVPFSGPLALSSERSAGRKHWRRASQASVLVMGMRRAADTGRTERRVKPGGQGSSIRMLRWR